MFACVPDPRRPLVPRPSRRLRRNRATLIHVKHVTADRDAKQNITLALPREVLQRVKVIAAEKGSSVSGLLTRALADIVSRDESYRAAQQRALAAMERPRKLGTGGKASWTREELHDR